MSNPQSRADRRQAQRTGPGSHPPHRDPMKVIYIGFVIAIAAVLAVFFFSGPGNFIKWRQYAIATATPTPGPDANAKGVQLVDGADIGKPAFPPGDTRDGGNGAPVDGLLCETMEQFGMHVHTHVALFVNGKQIEIPKYIGLTPGANGGCLYWLHTHNPDGIIHVEAPQLQSPKGGPYTLGMLFDIWGQPLNPTQIATYKGPVTAYVNGAKYDGELRDIPLLSHQNITLEIGAPLVPAPHYLFPPGD
jgi:hypothetical protein